MKKIIVLLSASLFLASCGNNTENTPPSSATGANPTSPVAMENVKNYQEALQEASSKITGTPEFNSCLTPYVNMCTQSAASELAKNSGNVDFCNELAGDNEKSACQLGVILSTMYTHKDAARCDIIGNASMKVACQSSIISMQAVEAHDIKICDQVKALDTTNTGSNTSNVDQCMMQVIMQSQTSKTEDCDALTSAESKTMCQDQVRMRNEMTPPTPTTPEAPAATGAVHSEE